MRTFSSDVTGVGFAVGTGARPVDQVERRRRPRAAATDEDTTLQSTLQSLAIEALNDLLKTRGAKPSAEPIDAGSALPAECGGLGCNRCSPISIGTLVKTGS
jgi:hypothetical protein